MMGQAASNQNMQGKWLDLEKSYLPKEDKEDLGGGGYLEKRTRLGVLGGVRDLNLLEGERLFGLLYLRLLEEGELPLKATCTIACCDCRLE